MVVISEELVLGYSSAKTKEHVQILRTVATYPSDVAKRSVCVAGDIIKKLKLVFDLKCPHPLCDIFAPVN